MPLRVKVNSAGVRELLGDPAIRRQVAEIADGVKSRAGGNVKVEQDTTQGYRGVVRIVDDEPGAITREANTGRLARALNG